ncbi:MAG: HAD family hydrolase [Defluviitaleaceae bacterium]|nr:HAD family hydrolase [Defluviitaleaceae bacterium]
MKIKMIALDLDGTLLRSDKTISDYSKSVIQKCRESGMKVIYATVRGSAENVAPSELFDGCVKKSGAVAYVGSQLIYERIMPIDTVREFLIACDKAGIKTALQTNTDGVHYTNFNVSEVWREITNYKKIDFSEINFDTDKIYTIADTADSLDIMKNNLPKGVYMFISRDDLIFFSHEEAVKSKATAALAEHWGIKPEEIICFGDDLIDIDLFEYCGISVAMGNALIEVKAAADFVCDTNDNDGVAKWLETNLNGI